MHTLALFKFLGRISADYRHRGYIFYHNTAATDNCPAPDAATAGQNKDIGRQPYIIFDNDAVILLLPIRRINVVGSCDYFRIMAYNDVATDGKRVAQVEFVCLDGRIPPTSRFLLAFFARDMGMMAPSPIVAPFFRARYRAYLYFHCCFQRTSKPA